MLNPKPSPSHNPKPDLVAGAVVSRDLVSAAVLSEAVEKRRRGGRRSYGGWDLGQ